MPVLLGAFLAWQSNRARKQERAVAAILALGGIVTYDHQLDRRGYPSSAGPSGPAWLRRWIGDSYFQEVECVDWFDKPVTDADVAILATLPKVSNIGLGRTQITDAALAHLAGLGKLKMLQIGYTNVGDDGMRHIARMHGLTFLGLERTRVSDQGIKHLLALTQVETLYLAETSVTDAAIDDLMKLPQLKQLSLGATAVSDDGMNRLRSALPNVRIHDRPN